MWGAESDLDRELALTRDRTHAERVGVDLRSSHSLDPESEQVVQGVRYAERGAGSVLAKTRTGEVYQSSDAPKRTRIIPLAGAAEIGFEFLKEMKNRILARE